MKADRHYPWRTATAMKGQLKNWPSVKRIVDKGGKRARGPSGTLKADSSDEDELPDPSPGPPYTEDTLEESGDKRKGTPLKRSMSKRARIDTPSKAKDEKEKDAAEKLESARALLALQTGLSLSPAPASSPQASSTTGEKDEDKVATDDPDLDAEGEEDEDLYGV